MAVAQDLRSLPNRVGNRLARRVARWLLATYGAVLPIGKQVAGRARSRHLFVLDVFGITLASLVALWFAVGAASGSTPDQRVLESLLWVVALVVPVRCIVGIVAGLYQHSWRFASVSDMWRIVVCVVSGTVAAVALVKSVGVTLGLDEPGPSFWLMEMLLTLSAIAAPRFAIRALTELPSAGGPHAAIDARRTLLFGAGWAGVMVARSAQRGVESAVLPVGFLDDDPNLKGRRVSGLPVYGGIEAMARATRRSRANSLLVTMPSASGETVRRVVDAAMRLGLEVRTVPPMTDLLDGSLDATRVRSVRVEDLLRRPISSEHAPEVKRGFEDRTVLITGAGGSIGSELARQVLAVHPARLILVDRSESALYMVQREIEERRSEGSSRGARWNEIEIVPRLVNVVSRQMMRRLFEQERPDVVFHAAAYKHVPMLEEHPSEAVQVNIAGTMSVVDAAVSTGVERFVLVSTDKAVTPSSVMGATKRVAEMLVAEAAKRTGRPYVAVRFGNVLGSNGSLIPILQAQLERGQPLTITHLEMTRYFMTIPEAAWLLLDAAALADHGGGLFVLDMGNPVKVLDIARDLARLSGRDPDSVPIRVIGPRRGEKIHEELFYDQERAEPTNVPKVLRVASPDPSADIRAAARELVAMATGLEEDELRRALLRRVAVVDASEDVRQPRIDEPRWDTEATRPPVAITIEGGGAWLGAGFQQPTNLREA